jgi:hypothetical protein
MAEGSHSISALLNSCTIFLLRGYCSTLWCEILEGREENTISIAPSHFIRTETAFDKERKEKKRKVKAYCS